MPEMFYLLACLGCGDPEHPLVMPFGSAAERGKWASAHTRGTGHDRWWVKDSESRVTLELSSEEGIAEGAPVAELWPITVPDPANALGLASLPAPEVLEHGTYAAYQKHIRERSPACGPCKDAASRYMRDYRAANTGGVRDREKRRSRARSLALERLAIEYPDRFKRLYYEALRDMEISRA